MKIKFFAAMSSSLALTAAIAAMPFANNTTRACCSTGPAHFTATKGLAAEAKRSGKLVHLLAYQNIAQNKAAKGNKSQGNAMLLPIPAVSGSMTQSNIVDTTSAPHFLEDMEKTKPVPRSVSKGPVSQGIIAIFNHDIYTIVLANDASAIPAALKQVPEDRRPAMNPEIFEAYGKWYKGWTFALCCFNNKEAQKAKPMLWWYEPNDPKHLFFPALDAHTGQAPVMNTMVDVDHTLFFSTLALKDAPQVQYSDRNIDPKLKELLPPKVMLNEYNGKMKQGDFRINVADLNKDKMEVMRTIPLGNGNFKDIGRAWDLLTVSTEPSRTLAPTRISGPESDYEAPVLKKTPSRSKTPKNAELHGPG